ncbi:MAG: DUF4097 domain-containing protein [Tannerellaceae bacterium]|jgi:hypothetical protein|nr:DUF4097 domain-containing protein [Tannerellaceae bacterium]
MKTMHIKRNIRLTGVLLILTLTHFTGQSEEWKVSKKKEIKQSFSLSPGDLLNVDNKYGHITITHWEKNEVAIHVVAESKADSESRAREALDNIQIELTKSGNTVYGITSVKSNRGWGNRMPTIHYYITMPSSLAASLSIRYGNINLPEKNEGKYNLEIKYGNLKAGSFTESANIDAEYSQITLGDVKDLRMETKHCGSVNLTNSRTAYINSKYSNIRLHNAEKLVIDNAYGNIQIEHANSISIEMKYGDVRIESVKEELNISSLSHSSMTVKKLDDNFKNVNAESHHSTLKLSVSPQAAFRISAEAMNHGQVNISGLKITDSKIENKTNYYYRINGGDSRVVHFEGNHSTLKITAL